MGTNSKIEWTHHTFNPWRGCTKVSAGCANCYAERQSLRNPKVLGIWGDDGNRVIAAESYWKEPLKWNKAAQLAGERHRVFCASLADIFEDRDELDAPRCRLFDLIDDTDNLDWLLLTKRPENFIGFLPRSWQEYPRKNVWLGVSVEDQKNADERIPELLSTPAKVRFLSIEPLLGPIHLPGGIWCRHHNRFEQTCVMDEGSPCFAGQAGSLDMLAWAIVGGESGPRARPMHPAWARSLRDQCTSAGVAFFFKQWGEWWPYDQNWAKGAPMIEPDDRQEYIVEGCKSLSIYRLGKHRAGRLLDGREWNEFPTREAVPA